MQDSRKTPQTSRENIACNDYPSYGSITWLSKALQPFQVSFANSTEYELLQSWPACYGAISLPRTRLNDSHLRMFITVALQEEYVRTALISFSSYVLYMKGETRFPTSYILESYQSSVQKLSRQLSARSYTHNYLALLISATMLGVVEVSWAPVSKHMRLYSLIYKVFRYGQPSHHDCALNACDLRMYQVFAPTGM